MTTLSLYLSHLKGTKLKTRESGAIIPVVRDGFVQIRYSKSCVNRQELSKLQATLGFM